MKIPLFFFNKCKNVSLFSLQICRIFVLSIKLKPMINFKLLNILTILIALATCQVAIGQGYEKVFGGSRSDFGTAVIQTPNEGFVIAGYSESFGDDNDIDVYLIRTDAEGEEIWSNVYDEGFIEHAYDVLAAEDGGFLIVGDIKMTQTALTDFYLLKVDANGMLEWSKTYGSVDFNEQGFSIAPSSDGGYVLAGILQDTDNKDIFIVKTDHLGEEVWTKRIGGDQREEANAIVAFEDGYIIAGKADNDATNLIDAYIVRIDSEGEIVWDRNYGGFELDEAKDVLISSNNEIVFTGLTNNNSNIYFVRLDANGNEIMNETFGGVFGDVGTNIVETRDGNFVIAGYTEISASNVDIYLLKTTPDGNRLWEQNIGKEENGDFGSGLTETANGGFAMTGSHFPFNTPLLNDVSFVVTDFEGNINSTYIQGYVVKDDNDNCSYDNGVDSSLKDWIITAEKDEVTYFGTSDENGFYSILVDTGSYTVKVLPQNEYWMPCIPSYNPNITGVYDTLNLNFPINVGVDCPYLEVDVAAPILSNCDDVTYTVEYCNTGTGAAENAYIEVTIDSFLVAVNSTSIEIAAQDGNTFTFNLGTIEPGTCENFQINASLDCEGFITGLSHQVSAHIYPDVICAMPDPTWDGSSIRVTGTCEEDDITFNIKNIGDNPTEDSIQYFVIEDVVIFLVDSTHLDPGVDKEISVPANGSTYRLVAMQAMGHPGNSFPTVAVEGCTNDDIGTISTGYVTQYQEDDADSFVAVDVQETIDAESNLRGYPKGYGEEHFISTNTEITYNITFENTGTEPIKSVVIRDTLPNSLDLSSVRIGASSHPYEWQTYGEGVLKISFPNIELASEEAGFIKFRVAQQAANPINTRIANQAAIYLGYDAPIKTNEVWHKVGGDDYIEFVTVTGIKNVNIPNVEISVFPNPFVETATFKIAGKNYRAGTFSLHDVQGKLVHQADFNGNQFDFSRGDLTSGIYFYHLHADGEFLNSGKIVVQ